MPIDGLDYKRPENITIIICDKCGKRLRLGKISYNQAKKKLHRYNWIHKDNKDFCFKCNFSQ